MRYQEFNDIEDMVNVVRSLATSSIPFMFRTDFRPLGETGVAIENPWIFEAEMDGVVGRPDENLVETN
jgi:hypothetical protein